MFLEYYFQILGVGQKMTKIIWILFHVDNLILQIN